MFLRRKKKFTGGKKILNWQKFFSTSLRHQRENKLFENKDIDHQKKKSAPQGFQLLNGAGG